MQCGEAVAVGANAHGPGASERLRAVRRDAAGSRNRDAHPRVTMRASCQHTNASRPVPALAVSMSSAATGSRRTWIPEARERERRCLEGRAARLLATARRFGSRSSSATPVLGHAPASATSAMSTPICSDHPSRLARRGQSVAAGQPHPMPIARSPAEGRAESEVAWAPSGLEHAVVRCPGFATQPGPASEVPTMRLRRWFRQHAF